MSGHAKKKAFRLLTYNIQVGLHTRDYGHMVSGAWRHFWPSRDQHSNLERIAEMLSGFDFVAIQEADAGSLRTRSRNQIEFLARQAGFDHCGFIVTRDLHPVARHCHGWMSRAAPLEQQSHSLPSRIPGRAAMRLRYGEELGGLTILAAHLSLGGEDRRRQLSYIAGMAGAGERIVMLGDLNSGNEFLRHHPDLRERGLHPVSDAPKTYPSWKPRRALDQVLLGPGLNARRVSALPIHLSDHMPLAVDVEVVDSSDQ